MRQLIQVRTKASASDPTWTSLASSIAYDPWGSITSAAFGNGLALQQIWVDGRLASKRLYNGSTSADETKVTAAYDANNNVTSVTRGNGSGTLTAAKTMTYDPMGNLLTVDGPLAGAGDTTRYRYDAAREVVGITSPDPDGAGVMKPRAVRSTYTNGLLTKQELGTVTDQSDTAWASFSPSEVVDSAYDANARVTQRKLSSGATAYALTQYSYDNLGRPDCAAQRMNAAVYGSLPASACTVSTIGAFGSDRISKTLYDNAGEVTQVQQGVGTSAAVNERTLTYSNDGYLSSLTDAENNVTTYTYDGFDRLSMTQFPSPAKGAGTSSATDFEQLGYDAAGNITSRRLRDGTSIGYTYDDLNRVNFKNLPGTEPDVSYGYDNLGRLTSASQTGNALSFAYDALSQLTDENGSVGNVHSGYDLAGNRTLLQTATGYSASFQYFVTGELKTVADGATFAQYSYDDLGNRTGRTFTNGTSTQYSYDPLSRLKTLTNDLAGTTSDFTIGGATTPITYNPVSQITSAPRSNDTYAWTGSVNVNRNYTSNGLNQYTVAGAASFTYDTKGNLTSDGTNSYVYSSENLLTSAPGATLSYDPLGRLSQITSSSGTRNFLWDGLNMIEQISGTGAVQHAYVFGGDEPLAWYDFVAGGGAKKFLHADERGSVVALSDQAAGNQAGVNSYDEYGIPGPSNTGLFQYTGQMWLSEIGMYYYKARVYSPTMGRFMQTDPIGYGDNANPYAYVHNDPVNFTDPLGLEECTATNQEKCPDIVVTANPWASLDSFISNWALTDLTTAGLGVFGSDLKGLGGDNAGNSNIQCPTAKSIDSYLQSKNSPVAGFGQNFISEGSRYNIDPRLPVAIMGAETGFGRRITSGANNLFNNLYAGRSSVFDSYSSSIHSEFKMLAGPNYAGLLGNTSQLYGKYCSGPDCSNGLNNLNSFLKEQGGNPAALKNPCPGEAK